MLSCWAFNTANSHVVQQWIYKGQQDGNVTLSSCVKVTFQMLQSNLPNFHGSSDVVTIKTGMRKRGFWDTNAVHASTQTQALQATQNIDFTCCFVLGCVTWKILTRRKCMLQSERCCQGRYNTKQQEKALLFGFTPVQLFCSYFSLCTSYYLFLLLLYLCVFISVRSPRRKPMQARGEHANSTQGGSNLEPSYCEAPVLATAPPCRPVLTVLSLNILRRLSPKQF